MSFPPASSDVTIEAALLLAAALPLVRLAAKSPVRREIAARPVLGAAAMAGAVMMGTLVAWTWTHSEATRSTLVVGASSLALAAWARARPSYGRRRRLAPGSLGIAASLDGITDEDFYLRATRRWGPVFKMTQLHRPVVCVADLSLALELLGTDGDALRQSDWSFNRLVPGGYLEYMNGALHARVRRILCPGFGDAVLADCRETITAVVRGELSQMARGAEGAGVDPVASLDRIAFAIVLRFVLGVPPEDSQVEPLRRLYDGLDQTSEMGRAVPRTVRDAFDDLAAAVDGMVEAARASAPEASRRRSVLAEVVRGDTAHALDETVRGNLVLLVRDGRIILRYLLHWVLKMRADHPAWALAMREQGEAAQVGAMAACFVQETLRTHGSPYLYRVVTRECRLGEYRLPRGWLVRVCVREAHRRSETFPDPERFDPRRFLGRRHARCEFMPFSDGMHACFAADLSVTVARVMLLELALAYDVCTIADGPPVGENRHWAFWQPSPRFRVTVAPRAA